MGTDTPEAAQLTGLAPNTTYHFQFVACNATVVFGSCSPPSNRALGADRTFTTLAEPPVARIDQVVNVSPNSATLVGSIDPNGVSATYRFEYGPSDTYGQGTAEASLASSSTGAAVAANISGIAPATTYHYRLIAINNGGSTTSEDGTFTTSATAPAVNTGAATSVTQTTASLGGTLNPQGSETTYYFQYGTSERYGASAPAPAADAGSGAEFESVTQTVGGLRPAATYHFRLVTWPARSVAATAEATGEANL